MAVQTPVQVRIEDLYRMPLDKYHQLIESGALDENARVEMLGGLIVEMSPKTPAHERTIRWLNG